MSFANTSILINRQVPEFVREDYPLFITFLEAYYEFLESKQPGKINDLTQQAKNLRYLSDVDFSIDSFENQFFNTFANSIPKDIEVNKEFLIKNILPLYLAKGNEASFKLLFRLLFDDEVTIIEPKNNILRLSDGKWTVDNILRIETDVRSLYEGTGNTTEFILAQTVSSGEIDVYVDDILKTEGTDYFIRQETRKIIFVSAPVANSSIKVFYDNFDFTLLNNRKVVGQTTGASAIVESASKRIITDQLNFGLPFDLFINAKTLNGKFINGEKILTDIIDSNGVLIELEADTFSILSKINVIDGGTLYNVGDPVLILGGGATTSATAEVEEVSDGFTSRIVVSYGGAGFKDASLIESTIANATVIIGAVDGVNTNHYTANTYVVLGTDIIQSFNGNANSVDTLISAADYQFPGPYTENVNTRIIDALTTATVTDLGPMTNVAILFSNTTSNVATLDAQGALYPAGNTFFDIKDFRSVGRIDIISGGSGYKVGDEIIFGPAISGSDAAAAVKTVSTSGAVLNIQIQPPRITGTANVLNNTVEIIGTGTNFGSDISIGDKIVFRSQERYINAITSSTTANVNVAFSWESGGGTWANNYRIGSFTKGLVGGSNYIQNTFPTVTVSTASGGSGANVVIRALMGNGEILAPFSDFPPGEILSIKLTSGGVGYQYNPQVDLTGSGDGTAVGNVVLGEVYTTLPGRWTTSDSIISSTERRLEGNDYYIDFSYVTSSLTSFKKYKNVLKGLLHPSGFVNYAILNNLRTIETTNTLISIETSNTISGFVETTNGSIFLIGTGTKFNVANSRGILTLGSNVSVNGQIRTISSIISNTNLAVSLAFSMTSNTQTLKILT